MSTFNLFVCLCGKFLERGKEKGTSCFFLFLQYSIATVQCHHVIASRIMYQYMAIVFQVFLYLGIIALVAHWLFPLHDRIESYFSEKVVWITGK